MSSRVEVVDSYLGITSFLENGGELETAQRIAAHSDSRTTKLYDRRDQRIEQGEIERGEV